MITSVKDVVGIAHVRQPNSRLGGGRINRQSDLPATPNSASYSSGSVTL